MAEDIIKQQNASGSSSGDHGSSGSAHAPTTKEVTEAIKQSRWGWFWGRLPEKPVAETTPQPKKEVEEKKHSEVIL